MLDTSGDNLHEISNPYFLGQMKKSIISLLLVDFAQSVLNVNYYRFRLPANCLVSIFCLEDSTSFQPVIVEFSC